MPQIYHLGKLIGDANPGHEILNSSGTAMTQRNKLQFANSTVTDDPTNDKTIVTPSGGGGGGGSTIKVTTTETTLRGKNITLTGSTTLTATFDSNGVATFTGVIMTGTLTLYTSDGTSSATKAISVPYFGNYEEPISFWSAIINVTATGINGVTVYAKKNGVTAASATVMNGSASLTVNSTGTYTIELTVDPGADDEYTYSESVTVSAESTYSVSLPIFITTLAISTTSTELYSQTITVTKGGSTVGTTAFSAQGSATFRVHETGTYTLTCTYGGEDYSESITIGAGDDGQTKSISIETIPEGSSVTPTDDIQIWLNCAGIRDKTSYTTLSDVLADHDTLYRLMADDNAVDYLVRSTTWVSDITADEIAMRYIGKWNYCSDTLLADSTWKAAIIASTYMSSVLNTTVPTMTSNTTPSGTAFNSQDSSEAYLSFDDNATTGAHATGSSGGYIGYTFGSNVKVCKAYIKYTGATRASITYKCKFQRSNNGTWTDISEEWSDTLTQTTVKEKTLNATDITADSSFRMFGTRNISNNGTVVAKEIQFYGRADVTENLIDVYGAAGASVYYMDGATQVPIDTLENDGHKAIPRSSFPTGTNTIYTTAAKDPANLSNDYSKTVTVTDGTSEIYMMPDGALYWYGYISENCETCSAGNGWTAGSNHSFSGTPTYNTIDVGLSSTSSNTLQAIGSKSAITDKTINVIMKSTTLNNGSALCVRKASTKTVYDGSSNLILQTTANTVEKLSASGVTGYVSVSAISSRAGNVYAFWYE